MEKANQAEFWAAQKDKKYATMEMIESIAFDGEGGIWGSGDFLVIDASSSTQLL